MRALWLPDRLTEFRLAVVPHPGWEKRGTDDFDPKVVVAHHTAVKGSAVNVCITGRPDLPGPLCHVVLARDGVAHIIAAGKANHAGAGGWAGYSGNRRALGIEAENDGYEPWPAVQRDAFERCSAALLAGISADPSHLCGHKEWAPNRKVDPHTIDMNEFRAAVGLDLHAWQSRAQAAATPTPPPPPPTNAPHEEDDIVFCYRDARDNRVWIVERGQRRAVGRPELDAYKAVGVLTEPQTLNADQAGVMAWNYPEKK